MAEFPLKSVVIYSSRSDILSVFRAECRDRQIEQVMTPEGVERCIEDLVRHPRALLVLDWQAGVAPCMEVLTACRSPLRAEIRPVFLFSPEDIEGLDGVCAEFGVSKLHCGPITRNLIRDMIGEIIKVEVLPDEVSEGLLMVAEARKRDDWNAAEAILRPLVEKYPKIDRLTIELAENHFNLGKRDEALSLLESFSKDGDQPSQHPRVLNLLGRIYLQHGDVQEATQVLQRAKLINPFNIERLIQLGDAYLSMNKPDRAEINFRQAVDNGSKDPRAVGGLGKSLLLGDKINDALIFIKQLSGNREMASVFNTAAVLSMQGGKYVDGMKLYHVALDTVGEEAPVLSKLAFNMGIGFHRFHDNQKAALCFDVAAKIDGRNEKAKKYLESLVKSGVEPPQTGTDMDALLSLLREIDIESKSSDQADPASA